MPCRCRRPDQRKCSRPGTVAGVPHARWQPAGGRAAPPTRRERGRQRGRPTGPQRTGPAGTPWARCHAGQAAGRTGRSRGGGTVGRRDLHELAVLGPVGPEDGSAGVGTLSLDQDPQFRAACPVPAAAGVLAADREDKVRVGAGPAAPGPAFLVPSQGTDLESTDSAAGVAVPVGAGTWPAYRASGRDVILPAGELSHEQIGNGFLLEPETGRRKRSRHQGAVVEAVVVSRRTHRGIQKINKDVRRLDHVRLPPSADAAPPSHDTVRIKIVTYRRRQSGVTRREVQTRIRWPAPQLAVSGTAVISVGTGFPHGGPWSPAHGHSASSPGQIRAAPGRVRVESCGRDHR